MASTQRAANQALKIYSEHREVDFSLVDTDPDQPRQDFDPDEIEKLAASIEQNSLLQDVVVRANPSAPGRYIIVAGERRFRAMGLNGRKSAVMKVLSGPGLAHSYVLSCVENLQRANLNPIEEAVSYQRLHDELQMSWEAISEETGRDVTVILTKIKLLALPEEVQKRVRKGNLPQVTALNLAQWQNEEGVYLRMAHDLIAGRDPAEIHFKKDTAHGQALVQAKLPKTPEDFARRIVKLSGHVQSMPAVIEAFLRLTPGEQAQVLGAINASVRGKLKIRFVALYRAIQAMSEVMNRFEAEDKVGKEAQEVPVQPPSGPKPIDPPKPLEPVKPKPAPVPTPLPPAAKAPAPAVQPKPVVPPSSVRSTPSASAKILPVKQAAEVSKKVIGHLFFSGSMAHVNLSRSRLQNILGPDHDVDVAVVSAIDAARHCWRQAPKGSQAEQQFGHVVARFRHSYGNPKHFDDALTRARKEDTSEDPVRFS